MMPYFIGIDSGSTMCKAVLFDGRKLIDYESMKTGWNPRVSAVESMETLLRRNGLERGNVRICTTGYGREAIDFAEDTFTEITCHAFGAMLLSPDVGGVIDIGGQDSKVIQIQNGKAVNFLMNDKCGAGTGRFLSMACEALEISLEQIDQFADQKEAISVTSMCTVFAESEIISLLSMQRDRSQIMTGVLKSIAQKIRQMTGKLDFAPDLPLLMTGGLSRSQLLIRIISETTGLAVITHEQALFAGAAGACVCAFNKKMKLKN